MIEAGRASSIASASLSKLVAVEKWNFGDEFDRAGERSGAETLLGRRAKVTRRRAFLFSTLQETSSYEDHAFQEN
jgi:uncharacterized membrane protein